MSMAPRKRPMKRSNHLSAVNTRGFPALADEIYLEIVSQIPSVPIPTPTNVSYAEIRRSRHEIFLSLSQTCRSSRRFFWRYLWQRIEVREGMKVGGQNDTLGGPGALGHKDIKNYAIELVRQLEVVTVRNPHLAQYVNYLDVFIEQFSSDTVLAELARCLSLFPNLHTIQVEVTTAKSGRWLANKPSLNKQSLKDIFERTFRYHSYPQIRNVFVMSISKSLIPSCPEARRVGFMSLPNSLTSPLVQSSNLLLNLIGICQRLEVLDDCSELILEDNMCKTIVESFPNLRHVAVSPLTMAGCPSKISALTKLNHLQTITVIWRLFEALHMPEIYSLPMEAHSEHVAKVKEAWIEAAKQILVQVQRRDKLEKYVAIKDLNHLGEDTMAPTIVLKPFEISL